ncbi:MAG: BatA domain-containing protein [Planctomycetota bacterium]
MRFLDPLWLWALPAIILPPIIHWLFRRRFKLVSWGAMHILERVMRQTKRRKLEELLLIALRVLLLAVLITAFARPEILTNSSLGASGGRPWVMVLDSSLSTRGKAGAGTVHDALVGMALQDLGDIAGERPVILYETPVGRITEGLEPVRAALRTSRPTSFAGNMERAVADLRTHLSSKSYGECDLAVYSDFQASDFASVTQWPLGWTLLERRVPVREEPNAHVASLVPGAGIPSLRAPWSFEAVVRGEPGPTDLKVSVGTQTVWERRITIGPEGETTIKVELPLPAAGWVDMSVSTGEDRWSFDNVRRMSILAVDRPKVRIWTGVEPGDPATDETSFFERALNPRGGDLQVSISQDPPTDHDLADLHILTHVTSIPGDTAAWLAAQVKEGSGLAVFLGERSNRDIQQSFPFMPSSGAARNEKLSFYPAPSGPFSRWASYFRPYKFLMTRPLQGGEPLWMDSKGSPVLVRGREGGGEWICGGFSTGFSSGTWVGSPLYLGLAWHLINGCRNEKHMGLSWTPVPDARPEWSDFGFAEEGGRHVAINPPVSESDGARYQLPTSAPPKEATQPPERQIAAWLATLAMMLLLAETFWNARQAR